MRRSGVLILSAAVELAAGETHYTIARLFAPKLGVRIVRRRSCYIAHLKRDARAQVVPFALCECTTNLDPSAVSAQV